MPELDLGSVIGPQGPKGDKGIDGAVGPVGPQGEKGDDGAAATINGVNALTIETGDGLEATMTGSAYNLKLTDNTLNSVRVVPTFTRPNLLDNWYFGNPVNQRGQTSYSGTAGYFIDRWQRDAGLLTTLGEDGIVCTRTSTGNNAFFSKFENYVVLAGARVTLSALVKGSVGSEVTLGYNVGAGSVYADYTACTGDWQLVAFTFDVSDEPSQLSVIARSGFDAGFAGDSVIWRAAKLELGPTQTLAHQDSSGNWMLNEIPNFGEQLRRCQRYCRVYKAGTTLPCLAYPQMDGGWYASAGLPTNEMRTIPTNNLGDGKKVAIADLDGADATHDDMSMTNWGQNENMLCLRISGGSHGTLTSKFPYWIKLKEDLILSADL